MVIRFVDVVEKLRQPKRQSNGGYIAYCPAHDDQHTRSLSVGRGDDGRALLHCFAGCDYLDIVRELGFSSPPQKKGATSRPETLTAYEYVHEDGTHLFDNVRREFHDSAGRRQKKFFVRHPNGKGGYLLGFGDNRRVLYRANDLRASEGLILFVEGEKDVDKLRSEGLTATTIVQGASQPWRDEYEEPLRGRDMAMIPDRDKAGDKYAATVLNGVRRVARSVKLIHLPGLEWREKGGPDVSDWLDQDHTVEELLALIAETPEFDPSTLDQAEVPASRDDHRPNDDDPLAGTPYFIDRGIWERQRTRDGETTRRLSNFVAWIVEEVLVSDGVDTRREVVFEGQLGSGRRLPRVRIPAPKALSLGSWIPEHWGVEPMIAAGRGIDDKVREAIQHISVARGTDHRTVFAHTGWTKIDGKNVYLMPEAAIGASDDQSIEINLAHQWGRYHLPQHPTTTVSAVQRSLGLLGLADHKVTMPLLGMQYAAPLVPIISTDVTLWLRARSGSYKSTLAALAMSHFGTFDHASPPSTWLSTGNAIVRYLYDLKDAPAWIDDYVPPHSAHHAREMARKADDVVRSVANRAGRQRLTADTRLRTTYPPRGVVLATAEVMPSGESVIARILPIEYHRQHVHLSMLTEAQAHVAELPHAMSGFIAWVAENYAHLEKTLPGERDRWWFAAQTTVSHPRLPASIPPLQTAFCLLLTYAVEIGALSPSQAEELRDECWLVLMDLVTAHTRQMDATDTIQSMWRILDSALVGGTVSILPVGATSPPKQGVHMLGWQTTEEVWLLPEAVMRFLRMWEMGGNRAMPDRDDIAGKLKDGGWLSRASAGRLTYQASVPDGDHPKGRQRHYVWAISRKRLEADRDGGPWLVIGSEG